MHKKRFVILSGPSCVGKGPLQRVIDRLFPDLLKARPILCHSRPPRAGEIHGKDYFFLPESFIRSLQSCPDFVVSPVRSDWQAIHLVQVDQLLQANDLVFAEVFYTFGHSLFQKAGTKQIPVTSVFLMPVRNGTPSEQVVATMLEKLTRRGADDQKKCQERALDALRELAEAPSYTHRLLNTAGEDDVDEWGDCGTFGGKAGSRKIVAITDLGPKARWLVATFVEILNGRLAPGEYNP
jgi:guanylate kinase